MLWTLFATLRSSCEEISGPEFIKERQAMMRHVSSGAQLDKFAHAANLELDADRKTRVRPLNLLRES